MKQFVVDTEVFKYDNIAVFKDLKSKKRYIFHNDNEGIAEFINQEDVLLYGFNIKHYDQYILKAICNDFAPEEVKALNDYIIGGYGQGWDYPPLQNVYQKMDIVDLMDDMQMGLSLKSIEAHLGMDIEETEVDFNLDRKLTPEEVKRTIHYCCCDVDATEKVLSLRVPYLENKIAIGEMCGLAPHKAMYFTNAKLTAKLLQAVKKKWDDERDYVFPSNILWQYIPREVYDFFKKIEDKSVSDDEFFHSKLKIDIAGCPVTLALGGIHGAIPKYIGEATDRILIRNVDVNSYYPSLMVVNGYTSRNIPDPKIFAKVLDDRLAAKKAGDKKKNLALKLVVNTTYGASLDKFNDLYDPLMGRSVCISGQLYLTELTCHLVDAIPGLKPININTDGVMVQFDKKYESIYKQIIDEWQKRTGFGLEEDRIKKIVQKDVNNYIEIQEDGSIKSKGGYLVKGIAKAGAFNINNNMVVVSRAVIDYFTKGISVEDTINGCDNILDFQLIAKSSHKYRETLREVDGEFIPTQRVNRVYASPSDKYGTIVKIHATTGGTAKIAGLPEHCLIDNKNEIKDLSKIDKEWYIKKAHNYIADFVGENYESVCNLKNSILEVI